MEVWLASRLSRFTLGERAPGTHCIGRSGKLLLALGRTDSVDSECRRTHDNTFLPHDYGNRVNFPIQQKTGWAPYRVLTLWRRKYLLHLAGIESKCLHCPTSGLFGIPALITLLNNLKKKYLVFIKTTNFKPTLFCRVYSFVIFVQFPWFCRLTICTCRAYIALPNGYATTAHSPGTQSHLTTHFGFALRGFSKELCVQSSVRHSRFELGEPQGLQYMSQDML
jgi:hypothetical protein